MLCAICVACSDCGLVNYVFSHAFFLERACFLLPASAWVYDLTLWLPFSSYACVVLRNYRLDIVHAAITDLDCVSVENLQNVKTNIARNFLCLIDKHFAPNHKLHKISNRNAVKVSYSCMNNVKSIISKHNTRITGKSKPQCKVIDPCTCRDKKTCPLQEKCMTKDILYKATVTTSNANSTKHYIGMTASTFKELYRNHIESFNHKRYSNDTELSKYIWKLKDNKQDFDITWSVLKQRFLYA